MVKRQGETAYTSYADLKSIRSKNLETQSYYYYILNSHEQGHFPDFIDATLPFYLLSSNALGWAASGNTFAT